MSSNGTMPDDPRGLLRAWLPHLAVLGLVVAAGWWLFTVIAPVRDALLLATSLAGLTYPVLFAPLDRRLARWFPHWDDAYRRYAVALLATVVLAASLAALVVVTMWAVIGSVASTLHSLLGLALHDKDQVRQLVDLVMARIDTVASTYPSLHLDTGHLRQTLLDSLEQLSVGPAFLSYLVTGTGGIIAQLALTLLTLFYLFGQGPRLAHLLLDFLPLTGAQRDGIGEHFHLTSLHLLLGTIARAAAHGLALGLLAWLIGGFNPVLVALAAGFIALLPVVGPTVAWLPLATALWTTGDVAAAVGLGASCVAASFLIENRASRLAKALGTDDLWLSFLLFLCVVGGVLGFGLRGLILGPGAVLAVAVVAHLLPVLYGVGGPGAGAADRPTTPSPPDGR